MRKVGSVVFVGIGITLGVHLTQRAKNYIEQADVVFVAAADALVEKWVEGMNTDVRSLQVYYQEGVSRKVTYAQMQQAIMAEVKLGKNVCCALYGHPGVFALVSHKTIHQALIEGYHASMEPGISAEDCLYADLGIDPGTVGCAHFEASQFLFYKRVIDPTAYLILWQVGIVGDKSYKKLSTGHQHRELLVKLLSETYPLSHTLTLYEAPTLPVNKCRIEEVRLDELASAILNPATTIAIPPAQAFIENKEMTKLLSNLC
ncbi:SAM-dependent methyltransferase [Aliikangiella maris]|uniref:SAM-dependent methyltransferase n=2 Tax=Aliikangiella maris TaxID=3162458 RepID=A0ABV2BP24_9GAMM